MVADRNATSIYIQTIPIFDDLMIYARVGAGRSTALAKAFFTCGCEDKEEPALLETGVGRNPSSIERISRAFLGCGR